MEYTTLSLAQPLNGLGAVAVQTQRSFGALDDGQPRTFWQRMPGPAVPFGRMLIRSQAPQATRLRALEEPRADGAVMLSPFASRRAV